MSQLEGEQILPTPLRVGADERFRGRGVTIAFLDSGFYPHPDVTRPVNRILHTARIKPEGPYTASLPEPRVEDWHGMMTSVVACGNGYLSQGLYRGIASESRLVLVRLGRRISADEIRRGLEWVLDNYEKYGIRIVNVSVGGDTEASYLSDETSRRAEDAVRAGLIVVVSAGNTPGGPVYPPASVPAVITVGGVNDKNTLDTGDDEMYGSSFGPTIDGLLKPEIVAPSILIAAPILPHTEVAAEAEMLATLRQAPDETLHELLQARTGVPPALRDLSSQPIEIIREAVEARFTDGKLISNNYKHVDGTSFAAPIVSSVVAQMLEANPELTPQQVKRILIDTAIPLAGVSVDRQGWGAIIPARAVGRAIAFRRGENHLGAPEPSSGA